MTGLEIVITHALEWNMDDKMFRCRTSACSFEVTWDKLKDVGYRPFVEGVIFVDEEDFREREEI